MATIMMPTTYYPLAQARRLVEIYQSSDADWTYRVVECSAQRAKVEVYDEDGLFVGCLSGDGSACGVTS